MLVIEENMVVSMEYILSDEEGEVMDESAGEPLVYLQGAGEIVPGLEQALEGLKVGDKASVTVQPVDGYGEIEPELHISLERDQFPEDAPLQPGIQFAVESEEGDLHTFWITDVTDETVECDGNHPLAGITLHFEVEIVGIREASAEEIEHGHAHGPDGHHHHH